MLQKMIRRSQRETANRALPIGLISISSGLLLASIEVLLMSTFVFHIGLIPHTLLFRWILGYVALLYLIAPIPFSLYIAYQKNKVTDGWKAGSLLGLIGALLATLSIVIYATSTTSGSSLFWLIMILVVAHLVAFLISIIGSALGSVLGKCAKMWPGLLRRREELV